MAQSIMKEKFLSMVESEKEKVKLVIFDELSMVEYEKRKAKLLVSDEMVDYIAFIDDTGKGKVDDLQNKVERLEGDLGRAEQGKEKLMVYEKGKAKIKKLSEDFNRLLEAKKAKEAKEAEKAKLKVKKEVVEVSIDEGDSSDEDVVLFNDAKYLLSDVEIRMFMERPTTSRAPTTSTSIRSRAPSASTRSTAPTSSTRSRALIASTSNAQAASTTPRERK
ncbi:hypothetical protein Tco_0653213 [Tanacetum coccineum]|uniref:Uncharacterized protein n=1 Tax=Tanacetum coccineum TaxID=301880 RepID=A0ABQ4WZU7_9ASTR